MTETNPFKELEENSYLGSMVSLATTIINNKNNNMQMYQQFDYLRGRNKDYQAMNEAWPAIGVAVFITLVIFISLIIL